MRLAKRTGLLCSPGQASVDVDDVRDGFVGTQREVADVAQVTEVTIWNRHQEQIGAMTSTRERTGTSFLLPTAETFFEIAGSPRFVPSRRDYLRSMAAAGFVGLAGCAGDPSVSGRWPRAGYDRRNTGDATDRPGPGRSPARGWHANLSYGSNRSTPVLAGGRLFVGYSTRPYVSSRRVGFRVFDADSGEVVRDVTVGTFQDNNNLYRDSVVVRDGAVYLLSADGLHSYTTDGDERWQNEFGTGPTSWSQAAGHPVVAGGTVYAPTAGFTQVTDGREGVVAVDDDSGELRWRYEVPDRTGPVWTFPLAYADGTVYAAVLEAGLVALDAATGEVRWRAEMPAVGPPTVADGRVFVETGIEERSSLRAPDPATGEQLWRRRTDGRDWGLEVAAANGRVFVRENFDTLACRDAATGEAVWRYSVPGRGRVSPARAVPMADAVYVGAMRERKSDDGVVALDPATGERVGSVALTPNRGDDVRLAASDDRLFACMSSGDVYAIEACDVAVGGRCLL